MKIILAQPGADWSTQDVFTGLSRALRGLGHDVLEYDLGIRELMARAGLKQAGAYLGIPPEKLGSAAWEAGHGIYADIIEQGTDAVIVVAGDHWHGDHTLRLRKAGVPVGLLMTESPYLDDAMLARMAVSSIIWTNELSSVNVLEQASRLVGFSPIVKHLPTGWERGKHDKPVDWQLEYTAPRHDVVFVGTGFAERVAMLEAADWTGIDLALYGHWGLLRAPRWLNPGMRDTPGPWRLRVLQALARWGVPGVSKLWQNVRGGVVTNERALALYRAAKVNLNLFRTSCRYEAHPIHVPQRRTQSLNPRAYELAASGVFWISEYRPSVAKAFPAVPTFAPDQIADCARDWLDMSQDERQVLAVGARRAVSNDSYTERAQVIVSDLEQLLQAR